jgi:hypothetical protein
MELCRGRERMPQKSVTAWLGWCSGMCGKPPLLCLVSRVTLQHTTSRKKVWHITASVNCSAWDHERHKIRVNQVQEMFAASPFWSRISITLWSESTSELNQPSYCCLSAKLVPTFADRWCHVVTVADPYGCILGFLDRSGYFVFQVAPQFYSRGWVAPVPDRPLLRKSGNAGHRARTSGSVARNSDHYTTESHI